MLVPRLFAAYNSFHTFDYGIREIFFCNFSSIFDSNALLFDFCSCIRVSFMHSSSVPTIIRVLKMHCLCSLAFFSHFLFTSTGRSPFLILRLVILSQSTGNISGVETNGCLLHRRQKFIILSPGSIIKCFIGKAPTFLCVLGVLFLSLTNYNIVPVVLTFL